MWLLLALAVTTHSTQCHLVWNQIHPLLHSLPHQIIDVILFKNSTPNPLQMCFKPASSPLQIDQNQFTSVWKTFPLSAKYKWRNEKWNWFGPFFAFNCCYKTTTKFLTKIRQVLDKFLPKILRVFGASKSHRNSPSQKIRAVFATRRVLYQWSVYGFKLSHFSIFLKSKFRKQLITEKTRKSEKIQKLNYQIRVGYFICNNFSQLEEHLKWILKKNWILM